MIDQFESCILTPRKIFLFGLCVIVAIFIISLAFPGGWKVGTWLFRYPDYRTWLKSDTAKYKNIQAIIASVDTADHQFDSLLLVGSDSIAKVDSAGLPPDRLPQASIDDVYSGTHPFEFPQGQDTLLFPLFRAIDQMHRRNKPLRILHYGDSQIEGDRITATIRNYMQKNYGGQGIGFLPIVPANDLSITFQQDISPNWQRVSVLNRENATVNGFGIAGNLARYAPSGKADSVAHVRLKPFYIGYRNVRTFTSARLFYGPAENPFTIVVNQTHTQRMMTRDTVSSAWWRFEAPQNSLDLSLVSSSLPDLYGIALDGARGVAVDNLPLRGSSGLDFTRMDTAQMGQMFRMMDVEMLILQFGANIAPHVVENYDYYARRFVRELRLLKALKPGLTIVVVGVNDMSQNSPEGYKSYPNIVKIRDAQKKAAFEAGCVFWDLYEAMGGENSMPSWAFAKPPLAQKDFVHFTIGGAKIVAELFCRAWEKEYQRSRL
jgi:hypothetical protein